MSYFWSKVKGINADLARHTAKEKYLKEKIAKLELELENKPENEYHLKVYRYFLGELLASKAKVASNIGKNK